MMIKILEEVRENIKNDKNLFYYSLVTMIIIFFIFNFFCMMALNLLKFNEYLKSNMQLKIYIEKNTTKEENLYLEKKLLKYDEIIKTKYVSKDIALEDLSKNLDLNFDYTDNPLPDAIFVRIKENTDIDKLIKIIKTEKKVESVEVKNEFLNKIKRLNKALNKVTIYISFIVLGSIFILIFNLIQSTILIRKKDIKIMALVGATRLYIEMPFIIESIIVVILASLISTAVFIPIYNILRESAKVVAPFVSMASWQEVIIPTIILVSVTGILISVLSTVITMKINLKLYGE
ncbi:MAG: hypothetical protein GX287_04060 [Fusobacteria bacterium]|nr:hypothetical protein [Fusobacteriota bacterium]